MEWLLVALAAAGGGLFGVRSLAARRALRQERAEDLACVRRLADEDVTVFGEQLRRLDAEVAGRPLDTAGRTDYQVALDAYESAQRAVPRLREADEISTVTDTLATGRHALVCVQARLAGRERPELRVPCFFNPQHGPSVVDVEWTPPGRGTRRVPACAQDAARVAAREKPEVRTVTINARKVAYWEAGAAYLPYGRGYFPAGAAALGAQLAWAFSPTDVQGTGGFADPATGGFGGVGDPGLGAGNVGDVDVGSW